MLSVGIFDPGRAGSPGVLRSHFLQQPAGIPIHIEETRADTHKKKNNFHPRAGAQPAVQTEAYGDAHKRTADKVQTNGPGRCRRFHAVSLLIENILEGHAGSLRLRAGSGTRGLVSVAIMAITCADYHSRVIPSTHLRQKR